MKIDIRQISQGEEQILIHYRELTPKIKRILDAVNQDPDKILGRCDDGSRLVKPEEILYLESVDDRVFAYTKEAVLRLEGSLASFLETVRDESFFRCSKSMILNIGKVSSLKSLSSNRIEATMEGGEKILISRRYASEFRKLLRGDK